MPPGAYRVEVSSTNRAGCKNKECKDAGVKIFKGQLRFGTFVTIKDFQSWQWKHWGCVTPKVIGNVKDAVEDEPNNLDGYEDLPEDLQEKVHRAIEEGHVDDEDWLGDVEMNRPGKNGFRTPETKRARKEESNAQKEQEAASPSQPPGKKRGLVKNDPDAEDVEDDGPAPKKKKSSSKKAKAIKEENTNGASEDEAQPAKKSRKKSSKVKAEAADEEIIKLPSSTKKRASRKAAVPKDVKNEDVESDALSDIPERSTSPPAKKARAPRNAATGTKIKDEDTDVKEPRESSDSPPASKKARAPRKKNSSKAIKPEVTEDASRDGPLIAASRTAKAPKAPRKKAVTPNLKSEVDDNDHIDDLPTQAMIKASGNSNNVKSEEDAEQELSPEKEESDSAPVIKKGGKREVKKAINGIKCSAMGKTNSEPMVRKSHVTRLTRLINESNQQTQGVGETEKPRRTNGRITRSQKG